MNTTILPLPSIDGADARGRGPDVSPVGSLLTLVLGEDLVLAVQVVRWGETDGFAVTICDGSANHLHTLALSAHYPSDAVLAAAIETAKLSHPTFVRIDPLEDLS